MTTYLLDVNLLVALFDPAHVHHGTAHGWFAAKSGHPWATCPMTENGFVRVLSNPAYPNRSLPVGEVLESLRAFTQLRDGHVFWPDSVSLLQSKLVTGKNIQGYKQVSDVYLLALCKAQNGTLATLDHRITLAAVPDADATVLERVPR